MSTSEIATGLSFWTDLTAAQQVELTMALHAARAAGMDRVIAIHAMTDEELRAALRLNR